jgi:hypothetical protein
VADVTRLRASWQIWRHRIDSELRDLAEAVTRGGDQLSF